MSNLARSLAVEAQRLCKAHSTKNFFARPSSEQA